ncbi:hypothetical protein EH240_09180 [Mesorhizobium tamadayense]|uniref:DUF2188 domain-containing protein n=1 Tax=Mesorhizobium tamadayense TaxID=425306 RepID=A0A3P3G1K5_9HYPH|nr:hypothetical protein [Mesorhizobium tamadayense]RRI03869.1 hypothetical protein EH240_09180 [Mesorhizobium tamadayense]
MNTQLWKTAVETEEIGDGHYVRVIEDGVVSIKEFRSQAEASSFASKENARLGISSPLRK